MASSENVTSASRLKNLKNSFDVIVVGGGIHGAALAWEATSRGLSVVLLEQADFGSGTSANSLKVIHGGIRYLQTLDLSRLRQSIQERRALLRIAPHLVQPMECVMPTYREAVKSKPALWVGTKIYDLFSRDRNEGLDPARRVEGSGILSLSELRALVPGFKDSDMTGGARWWDAQVHNSERLVLAFTMSARAMGAHTYNYVRVKERIVEHGRVQGVMVEDALSGESTEISGGLIMDCTGPWVRNDPIFQSASGDEKTTFVTAMNIIVRRKFSRCAIGIKAKNLSGDQQSARLFFLAPWREGTIIGTWYYPQERLPDSLSVTESTVGKAIRQINDVLSSDELQLSEVTAIHLGQLPASPGGGDAAEPKLLDKYSILDGRPHGIAGMFWVQGVKYTTARFVAEKALDLATKQLSKPVRPSVSEVKPLYGGNISDVGAFRHSCLEHYSTQFSEGTISRLLDNYGSCVDAIISYAGDDPSLSEKVPGTDHVLQAELAYILDQEMPLTLSDLILRRTDLGSFAIPNSATVDFCVDLMGSRLGWDEESKADNIRSLYSHYPDWVAGQL